MEKIPPRLHVLIASKSKNAVIIRKGPSNRVGIFHWDRRNNKIEEAQWLKGRIYARRSDISPNGKYWIYFAMNGKWESETHGSWTAIAKTPWLRAIQLFAKGDGWHGGGLFLTNDRYWLNNGFGHQTILETTEVKQDQNYSPDKYFGGECLNVYFNKLLRDGWDIGETEKISKRHSIVKFERRLRGKWHLIKICHSQGDSAEGKGVYWDEHELTNGTSVFQKPNWEWAECVDKKLLYAEKGSLFSLELKKGIGDGSGKLIHCFDDYKFKELKAPY